MMSSSQRIFRFCSSNVVWLLLACQCQGLSAPHVPLMSVPWQRSDDSKYSSSLPLPLPAVPGPIPIPVVGFYVHIPYCRRRCRYCNFAVIPVGPSNEPTSTTGSSGTGTGTSFDVIHQQYQADIFAELDMLLPQAQAQDKECLSSIYFGGGTPSLAPVEMIQGILERILNRFTLTSNVEITMEMDPGTFKLHQLQALKDLGINRISLGVQSFDDSILEAMGRVHRRDDVLEALAYIQQVYGEEANFSMDLISGVPGLTLAKWIQTLQIATSLKPSHLSIYDLQVEEGTVFGSWYKDSETSGRKAIPALPNEESVAFMYKFTAGYLRSKGYEHYEVSSYAYRSNSKDLTNRSRHNQIYWATSSSWYAVGLGATSYVHRQMKARPKTLSDYHHWIQEQMNATLSKNEYNSTLDDVQSDDDMLTDIIMKRLRTSDGLNLDDIQQRFGSDIRNTISKGASLGLELNLVETVRTGEQTILRLKDPDGFLYSNYIISGIFAELGYD